MRASRFNCLFAAAFMTLTPYAPQHFLAMAKERRSVPEKISLLRRLTSAFPLDASAATAREQLVALLSGSNRFDEALQAYQKDRPDGALDFKLIELFLKTGRYNDVLRQTAMASGPVRDFDRDTRLLELRVQAFLAKGRFRLARECVDRWLAIYGGQAVPGSRYETDVRAMEFLRRHLLALERMAGPKGKSLFTASVPHSLQNWSRRRDVPIVFFKLIPAHPGGQLHGPLLPGRHDGEGFFREAVAEMNRGFGYLSGGQFSVAFQGLRTLYVKEGDLDPASSGGHLLTSRVYVHTIPQLYKLAGEAFVVLIDYRQSSDGEAAYMGDGLIHLSARKFKTLVLMHELLHGLGATHREWNFLEAQGHRFDPADRGLMTFEQGELKDLGLEEKNRSLLGWPAVAVVRMASPTDVAQNPTRDPRLN